MFSTRGRAQTLEFIGIHASYPYLGITNSNDPLKKLTQENSCFSSIIGRISSFTQGLVGFYKLWRLINGINFRILCMDLYHVSTFIFRKLGPRSKISRGVACEPPPILYIYKKYPLFIHNSYLFPRQRLCFM